MDYDTVKNDLCTIISRLGNVAIDRTDIAITMKPYNMDAVLVTAILCDVTEIYKLDLNEIFLESFDFTIDSLVTAVMRQNLKSFA